MKSLTSGASTGVWARGVCAVVILAAAPGCAGIVRPSQETTSRMDPALGDFYERVGKYVALRDELRKQKPSLQDQLTATNQTMNHDARDALATRLQEQRAQARQGNIFAAAIAATVRQRLDREVRGNAAATTRDAIRDDGPAAFVLRVNATYPSGASLPTMPGAVLAVLPALPPGLEYRIVNSHLILRDTEANIIVDYLSDVMCHTC